MDKASRALRRSSVHLKSLRSGHGDLRMVISQFSDVRSSAKKFTQVQSTAAEDLKKWAMKNENQAIQDACSEFFELNVLWTEVQKEFTGHLKEFIHKFELILEGELQVDAARGRLELVEQRQQKLEKELSKTRNNSGSEENVRQLQRKLTEEKQARQVAQQKVLSCVQENEAEKMIQLKGGLIKLSESYLKLARKCQILFEAHREVALQIPDASQSSIHTVQYTGSSIAHQALVRARERLHGVDEYGPCAPVLDEPPPPYSMLQQPPLPSHGSQFTQ